MFHAQVDQLVFDFNCKPLTYLDPRWLEGPERAALEQVARSEDVQARGLTDRWLLERFGLAQAYDFDFSHPAKRLLLLDVAVLGDIARLLGLASLMHVLRTWVTRPQLKRLREGVGDETYAFLRKHMLGGPSVAHWVLDAQQRALLDDPGTERTVWRVAEQFGAQLLMLAGDRPQGAALRRAQLKLPPAWSVSQRTRALSPSRQQRVVEFAVGCVVKERHPAWHWQF